MEKGKSKPGKFSTMHRQAEEILRDDPIDISALSPAEIQRIIRELQDHQIELELQNEELRQTLQQRHLVVNGITRRKQAEMTLRESEERYRWVLEDTPMLICSFLPGGEITFVNKTYCEYYAKTPEELIGSIFLTLIPEYERETVMANISALTVESPTQSHEHQVIAPGGDIRRQRWTNRALFDAQGKVVAYQSIGEDITERKRTEEALQESEARYKAILEAQPDLMFQISEDGVYLDFYASSLDELYLDPKEFLGKRVDDVMPPEVGEKYRHYIRETLKTSQMQLFEYQLDFSEGPRYYDCRLVHSRENKALAIVRDITGRKQAEEALLLSRRRYQTLFNDSPVPLWEEDFSELYAYLEELKEGGVRDFRAYFDKNPAGLQICVQKIKIEDVNQAVLKLHNAQNKEELFGNLDKTFTEKSYDVFREELIAIATGKLEFESEGEVQTLTGEPRHIFLRLKIDKDRPRSIRALLATTDITERKQVEESLRQLNQAIEQSPVSVVITDTEGIIQYVNPKFTQVTGYSAAEVIGQNPRILQSGEHSPEFYKELWDTITAGREWRGEFHNRKKNGDLYWEMVSIAGVKDLSGRIAHYVAVKEDITQRKQVEEEHVRQERLAAVGQLSAGIAHDFNNVMAVITLYSELLQRSADLSKKERKQLQVIYQQANHAADLTGQILDFSRRSVREPRPLDLKLLLNEMLKFVERTIPESIQVRFAFAQGDYTINADPTQLQQVVTNLTVNARDAMPQGGVLYFNLSRLTLAAGETPPCTDMVEGGWVKLAITDTGIGIDPEVLPLIFEPFFSTKEVGKGTGLGLAQVYGIVQQHEGCIIVESRLGEGATFTIYLPALVEETETEAATIISALPLGQGETILVVEDDQILLEATCSILESLNYRVLTAVDGKEALNVYRAQPDQISLILADVVMPKMDGFELVKMLQQLSSPPKVLLMSGFPRDVDMSPGIRRLVSGWLPKPLGLRQLAETLRGVLT